MTEKAAGSPSGRRGFGLTPGLAALTLLAVVVVSCGSSSTEVDVGDAWPPYESGSPWNTPIGDDPPIHPDSVSLVARLGDTLTVDTSQYTIPVYEVDSAQPMVEVGVTFLYSTTRAGGIGVDTSIGQQSVLAPIPQDSFSARGSDGLLTVWNPETGEEWGFFQAWHDEDEGWSATNGYYYNTRWSGVAPEGFTSRGLGGPYLAGLLRPIDLADGTIDHALAFGYATPSPTFVAPAVKSDGVGEPGIDLPEGARLQLDPSLTRDDFAAMGLDELGITIAEALQTYGMILTDVSGSTKIFAEYDFTADWGDHGLTRETVSALPVEAFRVIAYGEPQFPDT